MHNTPTKSSDRLTSQHQFTLREMLSALTCYPNMLSKIVTVMSVLLVAFRNIGSTKTIQLLGLFSYDGDTARIGEGCMAAIDMAMQDIRDRSDLLPGYEFNLTWKDSKVRKKPATFTDKQINGSRNTTSRLLIHTTVECI